MTSEPDDEIEDLTRTVSSKEAERQELKKLMDEWIAEHGKPVTQGPTSPKFGKSVWARLETDSGKNE